MSVQSVEAFLEVVRAEVGAKRAAWHYYPMHSGVTHRIECGWSWGNSSVTLLFSDEIFERLPPISYVIAKIAEAARKREERRK